MIIGKSTGYFDPKNEDKKKQIYKLLNLYIQFRTQTIKKESKQNDEEQIKMLNNLISSLDKQLD